MTHWKKMTNPDYLGAYSLEDGKDIVLTIDSVREETVTGSDGKKEVCAVCRFLENCKPMILNVTNMKMIAKVIGSPYIEVWHGKKIQIGAEKVKAFGEIVEALRVRNIAPQDAKIICKKCGNQIMPRGKMSAEALAKYTEGKYGAPLCSDCAEKAARAAEVQNEAE